MTPDEMAVIHARAFAGQGRPWSADEFASLLDSQHVFVVGGARGFALGRVIADEVELLTIATDPAHQGQGLGRACLRAYEGAAQTRGAETSFLEVAADNGPALGLYLSQGYTETGRRAGYYARANGGRVDALTLLRHLTQSQA